jgi:hypothetical protein
METGSMTHMLDRRDDVDTPYEEPESGADFQYSGASLLRLIGAEFIACAALYGAAVSGISLAEDISSEAERDESKQRLRAGKEIDEDACSNGKIAGRPPGFSGTDPDRLIRAEVAPSGKWSALLGVLLSLVALSSLFAMLWAH